MLTGLVPSVAPRRQTLTAPALVAVALVAAAACTDRSGPVGSIEITPRKADLPYAQCTTFQLTWSPTAELRRQRGQPTVFVHLLDAGGDVVRTFDHPLPADWRPSKSITYPLDLCQSAFGPPLVTGPYDLSIGLVDASSGHRWELATQGTKPPKRREYTVGTVTVPPSLVSPEVVFGPGWMKEDPGRDRQVLARRKLVGAGSISIRALPGPGVLRLALVVAPGAPIRTPGRVSFAWPGAGSATGASLTAGRHVVELVNPGTAGEVLFQPPSLIPPPAGKETPWLALESLAWKPAPPGRS
jgi:hypothetical protein